MILFAFSNRQLSGCGKGDGKGLHLTSVGRPGSELRSTVLVEQSCHDVRGSLITKLQKIQSIPFVRPGLALVKSRFAIEVLVHIPGLDESQKVFLVFAKNIGQNGNGWQCQSTRSFK